MADPHIVLLDIETIPNLPAALAVWPQLSYTDGGTLKASVSTIACMGYKTFGKREAVKITHAWDFPAWRKDVNDDKALCEKIREVLANADCVVTHNGRRFDWKFIQTRLRFHKLDPLPKIHHVDTRAEAKRNLLVFNNKLQTVAKFLTDQEKMEHGGWDMWVKVHGRDPAAMRKMSEYCKQDITTLESVFKELRPLAKGLPNYNLFSPFKDLVCPSCGSSRLKSEGKRYTATRSYRRFICIDCKNWSHVDIKDEVPRSS